MSDTGVKISGLPVLPSAPAGTEPVVLVRGGITYQAPSDVLDNLAPSLPYAGTLTGDEITPVIQDSQNRLSTIMDQVRLMAVRRAGLVFDSLAQATALVATMALPLGAMVATACRATPADGGDAIYERVAFEPTVPGGWQDSSGGWWRLRVAVVRAEMFGEIQDGAGNAWAPVQTGVTYASQIGGVLNLLPKAYLTDAPIVIPRGNGGGGASGTVKQMAIIGTSGDFYSAGTILRTIPGGDSSAVIASEAWATNTAVYQSAWVLQGVLIDGAGIAQHGIANTSADSIFDQVYIRDCIDFGLKQTRITKNGVTNTGVNGDRGKWSRLAIRDCGVGISASDAADTTLSFSDVWYCNVCLDIKGAGWQIDHIRTYSRDSTAFALCVFDLGQGSRITNCVFGGSTDNPDIYQVELIHRFDPIFFGNCEISGPAGKGIRCSTTHASNRGLITITDTVFTDEAGATTCSVWMATNNTNFVVDVVNCVFRIFDVAYPFMWETGAELGQIYARNCRKIDGAAEGAEVIYEGIQRPGVMATDNPGVLVSGANPLTMTLATKRVVVRDATLTADIGWNLPEAAGEGQQFELIRSSKASGFFDVTIYESDGVTVVTTLPMPGYQATVMYAPTLTPSWIVVDSGIIGQPEVYGVNRPGVTVLGTADYTVVANTKQQIAVNSVLPNDVTWTLPPSGGEGQSYTLVRGFGASGVYNLTVILSDGVTVLTTLPGAGWTATVMWAPTLDRWMVIDSGPIERPQIYGSPRPGVRVTAESLYEIIATTPATMLRNSVLTADASWVLPVDAGDGQSYTLVRSAAATGAFSVNIYRSDGVTLVKAMPTAGYRVVVTYVASLSAWVVTEASAIS